MCHVAECVLHGAVYGMLYGMLQGVRRWSSATHDIALVQTYVHIAWNDTTTSNITTNTTTENKQVMSTNTGHKLWPEVSDTIWSVARVWDKIAGQAQDAAMTGNRKQEQENRTDQIQTKPPNRRNKSVDQKNKKTDLIQNELEEEQSKTHKRRNIVFKNS